PVGDGGGRLPGLGAGVGPRPRASRLLGLDPDQAEVLVGDDAGGEQPDGRPRADQGAQEGAADQGAGPAAPPLRLFRGFFLFFFLNHGRFLPGLGGGLLVGRLDRGGACLGGGGRGRRGGGLLRVHVDVDVGAGDRARGHPRGGGGHVLDDHA